MPLKLSGDVAGQRRSFTLEDGRFIVGSDPWCDIPIADPTVSRRHAEIAVEGDTLELSDLGSRNGTFVETVRIQRQAVAPGSVLGFGNVRFALLRISTEEAEPGLLLPVDESSPRARVRSHHHPRGGAPTGLIRATFHGFFGPFARARHLRPSSQRQGLPPSSPRLPRSTWSSRRGNAILFARRRQEPRQSPSRSLDRRRISR